MISNYLDRCVVVSAGVFDGDWEQEVAREVLAKEAVVGHRPVAVHTEHVLACHISPIQVNTKPRILSLKKRDITKGHALSSLCTYLTGTKYKKSRNVGNCYKSQYFLVNQVYQEAEGL